VIGALTAIVLLVAINGYFVAAEFALISAKDARLGDSRAARLVRRQREKLDEYLSACQLGITIASLALGALGEPTIAKLLEPALGHLAHAGAALATILALLIMTAMHITAGEQAPKSFAIGSAERVSMLVAYPLHGFYLTLRPLVLALNWVSNAMVRLLGGTPASGHAGQASLEELRQLIGSVADTEQLDRTEQQMLRGLFTLDERTAADVMTPRHRVMSLDPSISIDDALHATRDSGHSRFPLVVDENDMVQGFVLVRDLVNAQLDGNGAKTAGEIAREILVAPRNQPLDVLLSRLQRGRTALCAVLDEYGQFDGVVSVEDIIEEIVGEIWDEDDLPAELRREADGTWLVAGDTSLSDLVSQDIDLMEFSGQFDSVSGLIQNLLGEIPTQGDSVNADGYRLTAVELEGHRVTQVRIERRTDQAEAS
jgi:CBS domain containing-hemolysin-like protein